MKPPLGDGEPGHVGYWRSNEGNGDIISDASGNSNDVARHGLTWAKGLSLHPLFGDHSQHSSAPQDVVLYANYPNPFNPETTIRFDVP